MVCYDNPSSFLNQIANPSTNPSITSYIDINDFDTKEYREITLPISYNLKGAEGCNFAAAFMKPGTNFSSSNIIYRTPKDVELKAFLNPSFYIREGDKTNTRDINLVLYAEGAYEMFIADNPALYNATWEPFNTNKSYTLQGADGYRRIYVKFRDRDHRESAVMSVGITLDTTPPVVTITSPLNNAEINNPPITVTGTINDTTSTVYINGIPATNTANTYTVDGINLRHGLNTIEAKAIDPFGNISTTNISVNSTTSSDYLLTKLTDDIYLDNPSVPIAGTNVNLKVKLEVDGAIAINEPIKFTVIEGGGSLSQSQVNTSVGGEAQTTLTTGTNSNLVNTVEAYALNYPNQKITFTIYTKPGDSYQLVKVTDDSVRPVPGATIPLEVKLIDLNNNPIIGKEIQFNIVSGAGTLSASTSTTGNYGEARVNFTTPSQTNQTSTIQAKLTTSPSVLVVFTITTSNPSPLTVDQVMAKVQANDAFIQDIKADIYVTSNAPWEEAETNVKIWIKGQKQKVQEISPNPAVYIRPTVEGTVSLNKEIVSHDPSTNIYTIKLTKEGQLEEYPYIINYIDYNKGVIVKTEYHILQDGFETTNVSEYSDFVQLHGAWGYQREVDKVYGKGNVLLSTTTKTYANIEINTGVLDSEFQQ